MKPIERTQTGFTLIELMIVVAIIGILASVALPAYNLYANSAKFAEAVLFLDDHRNTIVLGAQRQRFASLNEMDSGTGGIPAAQVATATSHGIAVVDGVITVTWKADGSTLAGVTYTLTALGFVPPVQWDEGGTCKAAGYC